jgi:ABC-type sugar transport system substrate-binding protein
LKRSWADFVWPQRSIRLLLVSQFWSSMKKLSIVISLPGENKYLQEQSAVAEATARRFGVTLTLINANRDAVVQGQQLLEIIQAHSTSLPDGFIVEPVTAMGLPRVAEAAVAAGAAWVISNAQVEYLGELRKKAKAPVFAVSQDHHEIGRIQGRQLAALLPQGGSVLYLRGPASNSLALQRAEGMESAVPQNVHIKSLKIQWTEEAAYESVSSWLRLSTVHAADIDVVSSQNTDFILAARRAFQVCTHGAEQEKWLSCRFTGAGVLSQVKPLLSQGTLTAAAVTSVTMDRAIEMMLRAAETGSQPPEHTFVEASSLPSLDELGKKG